jgi:outer membrane protein OmpA-like peptidoglycan-associated protein/tetratricopeptide (TPR) repeat protein
MKLRYIVFSLIVLLVAGSCSQRGYRKAMRYYKANKYASAVPHFREAIARDSSEEAIFYLAQCYRLMNNYNEAEKQMATLVSNEQYAQPIDHYYYGLVLKNNGKYASALKQFEMFQQKRPNDPRAKAAVESCKYAIQHQGDVTKLRSDRVPGINSNKDDYGPYPYEKGMVFSSTREGNTGGEVNPRAGQPFGDLIYADRSGDMTMGVPKNFSSLLNTNLEEGAATYDAKRKIIYFTRSVKVNVNPDIQAEGINKLKIFRTQYYNGEWTKPEEMDINSDRYNTGHPALSSSGQQIIFASDRPGGYGGKDLYTIKWTGDKWSKPDNLGPDVNTAGDEVFPYFGEDGTLYFSSDFHPGFGGLDLFKAMPSGERFGKPSNLGRAFNTSADDFGIWMLDRSGNKAYISSNRNPQTGYGTSGNDDIYLVMEVKDPEKTPDKPLSPEYVYVSGKVLERVTTIDENGMRSEQGNAVDGANISLRKGSQTLKQQNSTVDGRFNFTLDQKELDNFTLFAVKPGYFDGSTNADRNQIVNKQNFTVELERIVIVPTYYPLDRATLDEKYRRKLDNVVKFMERYPDCKLELAGFTCPLAPDQYNYGLSKRRAEVVLNYLKSKGVNMNRVEYSWEGEETRYLAESDTKESVRLKNNINRRTEYRVVYPNQAFSDKLGNYYVVKPGDTIFRIAKNNGVTVQQLVELNNLANYYLKSGDKLKLRKNQ